MINIRKATRIVLPLVGGMIIGRLTAKAQNDYK
ncbi:tryptophan-rich sensory protein, partial [Staphylococcus epidermidis]|nr:tryptophan-rich sensory protein [Staphylococcus epidermidis]